VRVVQAANPPHPVKALMEVIRQLTYSHHSALPFPFWQILLQQLAAAQVAFLVGLLPLT